MAVLIKRAPLDTPKILYDEIDVRYTNHGINPYMKPSIIMCSGIVTSNPQCEEIIYEDPIVLPKQLFPNEDYEGKVCLAF